MRTLNNSTLARWLKKFRSGCKNVDDRARSGRPKIVDSEAVFHELDKSKSNLLGLQNKPTAYLQKGKTPPTSVYSGYDPKYSVGEASVKLEFLGMWSISSWRSFPGQL